MNSLLQQSGVGSGNRTHVIQLMRLSWHHLQSIPT